MGFPSCKPTVGWLTGILLVLATTLSVSAQDTVTKELLDMSLAELMNMEIKVAGTITEKNPLKTPASITTITAEDIEMTPARHLLDLIEIYVPGAFHQIHSGGMLPGIRGIIADRPYKYLVTVNGINVNTNPVYGAQLEIINWDLDDIETIEIIRGPGSVTYGPGAIGGVIRITTKTAKEDRVTQNLKYWSEYESYGANMSYSQLGESAEVYSYLSIMNTQGSTPDYYEATSGGGRYKSQPADYLADFHNQPGIKFHTDVHFKNNWRFWARYNAATSFDPTNKYEVSPGTWENFKGRRFRYFQLALENYLALNDAWSLKQRYGFGSIDTLLALSYDTDLPDNNPYSLRNSAMWAEYIASTQLMLQYEEESSPVKAAIGAELRYDIIRPSWGKSADTGFRFGTIISGPSSAAYGTDANGLFQVNESTSLYYGVGEGWETYMVSPLGELNWSVTEEDTMLISGRADKHQYTDWMFSPRGAWIHQFNQNTFFKLIGQRSVRMNSSEELFFNHETGKDNEPEVLHAVEGIYNTKIGANTFFMGSLFWNHLEAIAWNSGQSRTTHVGTLQSAGLELEGKYQTDDLTIGLNHSYVKQIDYEVDPAVQASGISYSDYYYDNGSGLVVTSHGNDLSNWSNHATKFYLNKKFFDGRCKFHGDLVTFWGFEGLKDGLVALESAGGDSDSIAAVRAKDVYGMRMTANLSLASKLTKTSTLILYLQNIPVLGDNKRYVYSSGFKKTHPDKSSWIEEPMAFGVRFKMEF